MFIVDDSNKIKHKRELFEQPYISKLADNQKCKGTLLFQTLKVGEKKVPSELRMLANWTKYGRFYILLIQNQKISQTLKVEFKRKLIKCSLFSDVLLCSNN